MTFPQSNVRAAENKSGAVLIFTFVVMLTLTAVAVSFLYMISTRTKSAGVNLASGQAFWLAEAGRAKARWELSSGGKSVGWATSDVPLGGGTYSVTTFYNGSNCTIIADGYVPDDLNPVARSRVMESNIPFSSASTNFSLNVTVFASSENPGHPAEDAVDGNSHSKWKADRAGLQWLCLCFPQLTTFHRIVINGDKIALNVILYSRNGWIYYPVLHLVEAPPWTFTFDPVSAKYLLVMVIGNKSEVNEIETYNSAAGSGLGRGMFSTAW